MTIEEYKRYQESKDTETQIQKKCVKWFEAKYPKFKGLLNYNLNNSANRVRGKLNKDLGLQPGRSDMVFYYNSKALHIEFKTSKGVQSKAQKDWQQIIEWQGFNYVIVRNLSDFKEAIQSMIAN